MSVTSAINYAESNVVNIDFKGEIGGLPDRVQRYTRHRFMTGFRFKPDGPKTKDFPVDHYRTEYHWDNATRTHFWRYFDQSNHLLVFFAYDQADSLRPKVKELLNAYPHDKCLVFDDLGDDSYASTIHTRTKVIKFQRFELLKAVAAEMTARYGRAFPAKYY
ncbi:uncharacterized protein LOC144139229 [Haemaphysalis longicornis]